MSSKEKFKRLMLELRRLRKSPASLSEIQDFLEEESHLQGYDFTISERTFSRDIKDIEFLFNIVIEYNYFSKKYEIAIDDTEEIIERMIEAFNIFNALNMKEHLENYIHIETRRSSGTEYLYPLIRAIRKQKEVRIQYAKFGTTISAERLLQPYGIKEFRNWWFLLAKDTRDGVLKNFAFDRIQKLNVSTQSFEKDPNFDINEYYKYSFGVTVLPDKKPQEIVLAIQGEEINYIKAMPLHTSQEIIKEDENQLIIKLYMYITWELIAELRSKGPYIEIISPESLKKSLPNIKYLDQF